MEGLSVKRIAFADKLKEIAYDLYSWAGMPTNDEIEKNPYLRDKILVPIGKTVRQVWIDLGTPAIRQQVYDLTWVNYVLKKDHGVDVIVIPDLRFPNEVSAMRERCSMIIKINRLSVAQTNDIADCALDYWNGWDNVIFNDGTIEQLHKELEDTIQWAKSFK